MIPESEIGQLAILNINDGDTRLSWNSEDPAEVEKAKRVVEDMMKRGYSIFIEDNGQHKRVMKFDPADNTYIVQLTEADLPAETPKPKRGWLSKKTKKVPAAKTKATAVAPTAGG